MAETRSTTASTTEAVTTATSNQPLEAKKGIDVILLYRLLKNASTEKAWKMAFQTEHENSVSRSADGTPTKDGNIQTLSPVEYELSATSIVAKGDAHVNELKKALLDGDVIEIWEIDKAEKNKEGKYAATYYQGYVTSFSKSATAEDSLELELEFAINGIGKDGFATLDEAQAEVVQYIFKDTVQETDQGSSQG